MTVSSNWFSESLLSMLIRENNQRENPFTTKRENNTHAKKTRSTVVLTNNALFVFLFFFFFVILSVKRRITYQYGKLGHTRLNAIQILNGNIHIIVHSNKLKRFRCDVVFLDLEAEHSSNAARSFLFLPLSSFNLRKSVFSWFQCSSFRFLGNLRFYV